MAVKKRVTRAFYHFAPHHNNVSLTDSSNEEVVVVKDGHGRRRLSVGEMSQEFSHLSQLWAPKETQQI